MPLPEPRPGLIFRYEYLWKREAVAGADAGRKDRPVCLVLAAHHEPGLTKVLIVPITRSPPPSGTDAIEIPQRVKTHLGLDAQRSWIILSEANVDSWPSPEIRPVPGHPGSFAYGMLPERILTQARAMIVEGLAARSLSLVDREPPQADTGKRPPIAIEDLHRLLQPAIASGLVSAPAGGRQAGASELRAQLHLARQAIANRAAGYRPGQAAHAAAQRQLAAIDDALSRPDAPLRPLAASARGPIGRPPPGRDDLSR